MKTIKCKCGKDILLDDEDYKRLKVYTWSCNKMAVSTHSLYPIKKIHRLILDIPAGFVPDHINRDCHDNRRCNLRIVTPTQNLLNRNFYSNNTSGYKGVYKHFNRWRSKITLKGKDVHLGLFKSKVDAARAYNFAAIEHHGAFAQLNNINYLLGSAAQ